MKKFLFLSIALMLLSYAAFAEEANLSQMDYSSLVSLKTAVEAELRSRPEASPFELTPGMYTVGVDIMPGRYFVATCVPGEYSGNMNVYVTKESYAQRPEFDFGYALIELVLSVEREAVYIELTEGNFVVIQTLPAKFSIFPFEEEDYYQYAPPEGTYVPVGIYTVGEDIPAGTYRIYPASYADGKLTVLDSYPSQNPMLDYVCIELTADNAYETIRVDNGNVIRIEGDVIMKKQPLFTFD